MSEIQPNLSPAAGPGWARPGRRAVLAGGLGLLVAGCAGTTPEPTYSPYLAVARSGARADHVLVKKSARSMYLLRGRDVLARYDVHLGFAPEGHKQRRGDGRTPEGRYTIDRRNPRSQFFLSLGVSYPNRYDWARAMAMGVHPGGDIFIHGEPNGRRINGERDWTAGCIAVTNEEMEEVWAMVPTGIPITILA